MTTNKTILHTPGPWQCTPGQDTIWANDGELRIAKVDYTPRQMKPNEDSANAMLMAAAPDLLKACKAMFEAPLLTPIQSKAAWDLARAAISKAEISL